MIDLKMAKLTFKDLEFKKIGNSIRTYFLKNFFFDFSAEELEKIGKFKIQKNALEFEGSAVRIKRQFDFLLEQKLQQLKNLQGKNAIYIYEGLIPLIGSLYFGILDRNTNVVEVRPITGCNLNCVFCSVDLSKRERDFVVSVDYLIKEFRKIVQLKLQQVDKIEAHINAQGEPLLYGPIIELIEGLAKTKGVSTVSLDTNGCLLSESLIDKLVEAGVTRFNISLNAIEQETANKIAARPFPMQHVLNMCCYIVKKSDLLLAPVWLHGINDLEIEKIIQLALELKKERPQQETPFIGIQNFLEYEHGKKPVKQQSWEKFYSWLSKLEQKYNLKLRLSREDFGIKKAVTLAKPFKKGQTASAKIVCQGKFTHEMLAASQDRIIAIPSCAEKIGKNVKVKITRDKYNIFYGKEV